MINEFSLDCLELYRFICETENTNRNDYFSYCINKRLNDLIEDNSKQFDYLISQLEAYVDNIITEKQPYERCSNYKERNKNITKYNINFINKIIRKYNKMCISSTKMLCHLVSEEVN